MGKSFKLVDQPWIVLSDGRQVSLWDICAITEKVDLSGTPLEKVSIIKLLLAIAHASGLPEDVDQWNEWGALRVSSNMRSYLLDHKDKFDLYGDHPFLQMPAISPAEVASWAALNPQYASGNTSVLTKWQVAPDPTEAQKAMLLLVLSSFAFGGKKTDNSVVLSPGYLGKLNATQKPSSSPFGPSLGFMGMLHSFLWGKNPMETVWLNMLTHKDVSNLKVFSSGLGNPCWEKMPQGEDDVVAQKITTSIAGRLVPLSRFCLLTDGGMHYSEGLKHLSYKEGVCDLSVGLLTDPKKNKVLWANPDKRPWRELPALLALLSASQTLGFRCAHIDIGIGRIRHQSKVDILGIWSGGVSVTSNAGEQYLSGPDDMVESILWFDVQNFGQIWMDVFGKEMDELNNLSTVLYKSVFGYHSMLTSQGEDQSAMATRQFWDLAEKLSQDLVVACALSDPSEEVGKLRKKFASICMQTYDNFCAHSSPRQLAAWAKCKPKLFKYLSFANKQQS